MIEKSNHENNLYRKNIELSHPDNSIFIQYEDFFISMSIDYASESKKNTSLLRFTSNELKRCIQTLTTVLFCTLYQTPAVF